MSLFKKKHPVDYIIPGKLNKIFVIGLSGTGTRSLNEAFRILGYKAKHNPLSMDDFDSYQVLSDISVSCRYRELDRIFPNSKFILTVRDLESWLDNRSRKPADKKRPSTWVLETRLRTYGSFSFEKEPYIQRFTEYHNGVYKYFEERPDDFLVQDVLGGDGWKPLCDFLEKPVPDQPFPWVGKKRT